MTLSGRCQSRGGRDPLRPGETQITRLTRVIMAKQNYQPPRLTLPVGERDHSEGPSDARMVLVEYGDYQCPYCGAAYPIMKKVQKELGTKRCQRHADVLHWWRQIRWLSGIWPFNRRARKGREGLTAAAL